MIVLLRDMTIQDLELVLAWRNHPDVLKGSYTQHMNNDKAITWNEHYKFWKDKFSQTTWKCFIIQINDGHWTRDVGVLQLGQLDCWRPEIGVYVGEVGLWGQGIAKQAIKLGQKWLWENDKHRLSATIIKDNERSIKLFESCGFFRIGEARPNEWAYDTSF